MAVLLVLLMVIVNGYHLSYNEFNFSDGHKYCQQRCDSQLASIHNQQRHQLIQNLINYTNTYFAYNMASVRIGLYEDLNNSWKWIDNSSFDFGNDTSGGISPWKKNKPDTTDIMLKSVVMDKSYKYEWNERYFASSGYQILCNDCNSKINKYIVSRKGYNYSHHEKWCQDVYGTGLASIHNQDDMIEAKSLCASSASTSGSFSCYIGLRDISMNETQRNFTWSDGTDFDFGTDISGGVYPWGNITNMEPNYGNDGLEKCVRLRSNEDFNWADRRCDSTNNAICNAPSEICYTDSWNIIYGNQWIFEKKPCLVSTGYNAAVLDKGNVVIIGDKRWDNGGNQFVIEFMYTLNEVDNVYGGDGGIIIHMNAVCNHYYYVGINTTDGSDALLFLGLFQDALLMFVYEFGKFYRLKIVITNGYMFDIYVDDELYISTSSDVFGTAYNALSGYVGIRTNRASLTAKSLFVSGDIVLENNKDVKGWFKQCNTSTTANPTVIPTNYPTAIPILSTSAYPTTNPHIFTTINQTEYPTMNINECNGQTLMKISFDYKLNSGNASLETIRSILINATDSYMEEKVDEGTDCEISDYLFTVQLYNNSLHALINATICFNCKTGEKLIVDGNQNDLATDFVESVRMSNNILTVIANSTKISVEIVKSNDDDREATTTIFQNVHESNASFGDPTMEIVIVSLIIVVCIISVFGIGLIYYKKIKIGTVIESNMSDEVENVSKHVKVRTISCMNEQFHVNDNNDKKNDYTIYYKHSVGSVGNADENVEGLYGVEMVEITPGATPQYKLTDGEV